MAKTSKQKPQPPEVAYQKVFKNVSKILEPNEDYIYRGEDEQFDPPKGRPCASSLYRESKKVLKGNAKGPDEPLEEIIEQLSKWNRERLIEEIRAYYPDTTDNERLAAVQHLGGATNFVDFSEDFNVALFFACYKNLDKKGRIIVMPSSKNDRESTSKKENSTNLELLKENKTFIPRRTGDDPGYQRARAQKGLVVYCPEGYIKGSKYKKVEIAGRDKLPILEYLRKYHGIDYQTIFYDVHGYIELTKHRHTRLREYFIEVENMKYKDAEKKISELINMGGTYWEYNERGNVHNSQGSRTRAISDYDRAIKINPKYSAAYYNRGNAYSLQGDHIRAISDYDQAIKLNSQFSEAYNNRGIVYGSQGNHIQAMSDYNKAVKFNPENDRAYVNRGVAYFKQGKYDLAILDYDEAIKLNSEDDQSHYDRGRAHLVLNNYEQAKKDYLRAVELNPEFGTPEHRKPFEKYL